MTQKNYSKNHEIWNTENEQRESKQKKYNLMDGMSVKHGDQRVVGGTSRRQVIDYFHANWIFWFFFLSGRVLSILVTVGVQEKTGRPETS